jgi:hypothetical protein
MLTAFNLKLIPQVNGQARLSILYHDLLITLGTMYGNRITLVPKASDDQYRWYYWR